MKQIVTVLVLLLTVVAVNSCTTSKGSTAEMSSEPIMVEFESGEVEGNIVMNVGPDNPDKDGELQPASGDMFYMKDSGSLTVTFDVPAAGDYIVKIFYALPDSYGNKENNVKINSEDLGALPFPITQGKWAAKWIQATLKEGTNTISVSHNWGYTWFDYLTVEPIL